MRLELVSELRDMKDQLKASNQTTMQLLQELRVQNAQRLQPPEPKPEEIKVEAPKDLRVELTEE